MLDEECDMKSISLLRKLRHKNITTFVESGRLPKIGFVQTIIST